MNVHEGYTGKNAGEMCLHLSGKCRRADVGVLLWVRQDVEGCNSSSTAGGMGSVGVAV